jgi:guanine deaminase
MPIKTDPSLLLMRQAIEQARTTMNSDIGGPFGALIIDQTGKILAIASNSVLHDHDATAHAEVNAIRLASKAIGSHDLSGCILYTTAYPCPMCLGAILWANIKKVIYGCRPADADAIGFRDDFMYAFLKNGVKDASVLDLTEQHRDACLQLFAEYQKKNKKLY